MNQIQQIRSTFLSTIFLAIFFILSLLAFTVFTATNSQAKDTKDQDGIEIAKILAQKEVPDGVVFELIGSEDSDYLPNGLKKIEAYKKQLQSKFPKLDIAVVSHGAEQFELTKDNANTEKESHKRVQRLVAANVPVHICETHASWRGVTPEDFPDYITPSPQGPAQIRQYQELGYILIVIE